MSEDDSTNCWPNLDVGLGPHAHEHRTQIAHMNILVSECERAVGGGAYSQRWAACAYGSE
jgi:hypothetical protein